MASRLRRPAAHVSRAAREELTMSYGDEVAYHEHYDLTSSITEVEQQAYSAEQALQGMQGEISRLKSEIYDLRSEVSGLGAEVAELTGRVEDLEAKPRH
jgi:predicted  nucleic acid-binding Zn-ribbon protein